MHRTTKFYITTIICLILPLLFITFSVCLNLNEDNKLNNLIISPTPTAIPTVIPIQITNTKNILCIPTSIPIDNSTRINIYIRSICKMYNVEPELIMSIVYHESRYISTITNGNCIGLMQVSRYWNKDRAIKLGITNFYDEYSNLLIGIDFISELSKQYKDIKLVLMLYNMNHSDAFKMYKNNKISNYAKSILIKKEQYKKGE